MTAAAPNPDDLLAQLSAAIAARVAAAAPILAAIDAGRGRWLGGILWRPGVVVTSRQALPRAERYRVVAGGETRAAAPAGDDPGTNLAVLRVEGDAAAAALPARAGEQRPGMLALLLGVAGDGGRPAARLVTVQATGPAWHSLAGGRIDRLLRLDGRLGPSEEGGPVMDAAGALLGMSTAGPRGRALVIPHETVERALDAILRDGRVGRAWLGLGLQPVELPAALREAAAGQSGLMVVGLASGGPAEQAGVLPGDILLAFGGVPVDRPRSLAALLGAERVGVETELRILRAGEARTVPVTPAPRPAAPA